MPRHTLTQPLPLDAVAARAARVQGILDRLNGLEAVVGDDISTVVTLVWLTLRQYRHVATNHALWLMLATEDELTYIDSLIDAWAQKQIEADAAEVQGGDLWAPDGLAYAEPDGELLADIEGALHGVGPAAAA